MPRAWKVGGGRSIDVDQIVLMGILNVTPDSFSDGGAWCDVEAATTHAIRMHAEGATIIDVGGESTRPGAATVSVEEQIDRTCPVIEGLCERLDVVVSIDTTRAAVAAAALSAGASIINDVSAGQDDPEMFALATRSRCGLVLMHRRVPPSEDAYSTAYDTAPAYTDVCAEVASFLAERGRLAEAAGVRPEAIVIDPGLGFGKSVEQNMRLMADLGDLQATGYPLLMGASRKSFLGVPGDGPRDRVAASVAAACAMWTSGARIFRVHDVAAHAFGLAVTDRIRAASKEHEPHERAHHSGR